MADHIPIAPMKPLQRLAHKARDEMAQAIIPCDLLVEGASFEGLLRPALIRRLTAAIRACTELIDQLAETLEAEGRKP